MDGSSGIDLPCKIKTFIISNPEIGKSLTQMHLVPLQALPGSRATDTIFSLRGEHNQIEEI